MKNFKELQERNSSLISQMTEMNNGPKDKFDAEQYDKMFREVTANAEAMKNITADEQYRQIHREGAKSLTQNIREAIQRGGDNMTFTMPAGIQNRANEITTGVAAATIETEVQGILEPLYAKSVLAQLGARFYTGLPKGDVSVPVMGKGTVGWASEIGAAGQSTNTFTGITLKPKRITAYVDISKTYINQDTKGGEAAIRRDLANAVADKLEETIFGSEAGTTDKPAGMFYGTSAVRTLTDATTFAKMCDMESNVEESNVTGEMKYLLSPKAKSAFRTMATNGNGSPRVFMNGEVDGTSALVTSNVKSVNDGTAHAASFIYGNFDNLAIGSWGDVEITVDPYTQATNGCIRLVVNAWFDEKILREEAFAYGYAK